MYGLGLYCLKFWLDIITLDGGVLVRHCTMTDKNYWQNRSRTAKVYEINNKGHVFPLLLLLLLLFMTLEQTTNSNVIWWCVLGNIYRRERQGNRAAFLHKTFCCFQLFLHHFNYNSLLEYLSQTYFHHKYLLDNKMNRQKLSWEYFIVFAPQGSDINSNKTLYPFPGILFK